MTDSELLQQFVAGSQLAFTTLVQRHFDLVHSAAQRQLHDPHLAEDVAQRVFLILSLKARKLQRETVLAAWLYNATRYAVLDAIKQRARRQRHERKAAEMALPDPHAQPRSSTNNVWDQIEPVLDAAMSRLSSTDRQLLLLRFWENRSTEEVAQTLKVSTDAAKKRLSRAMERLRGQLATAGVAISIASLPTLLQANAVLPAPAGMALSTASIISSGASTGATSAAALKGAIAIMAWTKAKIVTVAALVLLTLGGGTYVVTQMRAERKPIVLASSADYSINRPDIPINNSSAPEWRQRFDSVYRLEPGQLVKLVRTPFMPERKIFWQSMKDLSQMMPDSDRLFIHFTYDGTVHFQSAATGGSNIGLVLESLGFGRYQIEGPIDPWEIPYKGDLVAREPASLDQKLAAIAPLLADINDRPIHFEKRRVTRDAIIIRGQYRPVPVTQPAGAGPYKAIDISDEPIREEQYATSTNFGGFCSSLQRILRHQVIDQRSDRKDAIVSFREPRHAGSISYDTQNLQSVLAFVGQQMSLEFSLEPREIDIWVASAVSSAATQPATGSR